MNALRDIPQLGVGLGFRSPFFANLMQDPSAVDFLEITADHYFNRHADKQKELALLQEQFTLIPHGLDLSLGSADGLEEAYLEQFARLVERIDPPYWSEHLAFTRSFGVSIGHLSPLPYSEETLEILQENIAKAKQYIPKPLILENITYQFTLANTQMSEGRFIRRVLEDNDCGLLLDITNLYTNSQNHRFDYQTFLAEIPLERVVQLHFAGGYWDGDRLIDGHSHPTPEAVWQLMAEVQSRCQVKGIILERDENLPLFAEIKAELQRASHIFNRPRHKH